uniref:Uncharacterized protein n=2 Tax=Chrysotila carterae TaxID=13221 RepID=A0A7S4F0R7_CHRCT
MCVTDPDALTMSEARRRETAEAELDSAAARRAAADAELASIERDLEAVQLEHHKMELEKEKAEKELKELMARFKLRKSLLHWRHRKLTLSFRALITIVFRDRILAAQGAKASADLTAAMMKDEMDVAVAARQKAEAAKRKSEEMLSKELALKKELETDSRECEKLFSHEAGKQLAAEEEQARLKGEGADKITLDSKEKEEVLALAMQLAQFKAESEVLQQQLKRKTGSTAQTHHGSTASLGSS